jgi:hypothetical protein
VSPNVPTLEPWETDDWQWFHDGRAVTSDADWLSCPNPGALLDYVNQTNRVGRRKCFLAGAACVRRIWNLLVPESRAAVVAAERFADGLLSREELPTALWWAEEATQPVWPEGDARWAAWYAAARLTCDPRGNHGNAEHTMYAPDDTSRAVAALAGAAEGSDAWHQARQAENRIQADLYRCVMGNPFRPVAVAPAWRSEAAVALASAIYADRAFDRMPIMADALEEAGCDHADVLAHCRGPGPHARGCWVVDLVLGKE